MAMLRFKICMPMHWLAGNSHALGQTGYDWSARSMGKAIDALHDALIDFEQDGSLCLNEEFINQLFSTIHMDKAGNPAPFEPLEEALLKRRMEQEFHNGAKVLLLQ